MNISTSPHVIACLYVACALALGAPTYGRAETDNEAAACAHPVTRQYSVVSGTARVTYEMTTCEEPAEAAARQRNRLVPADSAAPAISLINLQSASRD